MIPIDEVREAQQYYRECKRDVQSLKANLIRKEAYLTVAARSIDRMSYQNQIKEIRRRIRIIEMTIYGLENPPEWAGYTASDLDEK